MLHIYNCKLFSYVLVSVYVSASKDQKRQILWS